MKVLIMKFLFSLFIRVQTRLLKISGRLLKVGIFIGVFTVLAITYFILNPMNEIISQTGFTILEFQLAWTKSNMDEILIGWGNVKDDVIQQTWLDFIFIIGLVIFFVSISLLLAKSLANRIFVKLSKLAVWTALLEGLFDFSENIFSLLILTNPTNYPETLVFLVSLMTTLKFLFLGIEVLIVGIAIIVWLIEKIR